MSFTGSYALRLAECEYTWYGFSGWFLLKLGLSFFLVITEYYWDEDDRPRNNANSVEFDSVSTLVEGRHCFSCEAESDSIGCVPGAAERHTPSWWHQYPPYRRPQCGQIAAAALRPSHGAQGRAHHWYDLSNSLQTWKAYSYKTRGSVKKSGIE